MTQDRVLYSALCFFVHTKIKAFSSAFLFTLILQSDSLGIISVSIQEEESLMQREKAPGAPVFRNEWKHLISPSDRAQLRTRLSAVAYQDPHAIDGRYKIRSLYFDTISDRVLREKIDGVSVREKFRIRYYSSRPA